MQQSINFKDLSTHLKPFLISILTEYCPGGELQGREYKAASVNGGKGSSFSFNIDTQKWADFAFSSHAGNDIISFVAISSLRSRAFSVFSKKPRSFDSLTKGMKSIHGR